ncbi:MAG: hypothetical protein K2N48_12030 [Muribaculaceae bacterium]|nr:hypothetical protein [Muribaculaceae bacterium]
MKKKVLGLALMAMALIGFNGMAQDTKQCDKAKVENSRCKKGGNKEARAKMNPYEGLTLTDAQKSKLADLDSKRIADHKAKMEARKNKGDGQKADRSRNEADMKARMDARKADKMEYLQEVKAIVGPEQYVVFLENMYVNGNNPCGGKAIRQGKSSKQSMAHNKDARGHRKGDRKGSQRGQKSSDATNARS